MDIHERALGFVGKELVYRPIDFVRYRKPHVIEYPRHAVVLNPQHTRQHREEVRKSVTQADHASQGNNSNTSPAELCSSAAEDEFDEGDPRGLTRHDYLCNDQTLGRCMHLRWRHVSRAGLGLCNLGNTCFANCVLQAMAYTPALSQYFAEVFVAPDRQIGCPYDFAYALGETMRQMQPSRFARNLIAAKSASSAGADGVQHDRASTHSNNSSSSSTAHASVATRRGSGGEAAYRPGLVLAHLHTLSTRFRLGQQSDAHEFATQLLFACQKSILFRHVGARKLTLLVSQTTALLRMCGGFLRSQVCWQRAEEVRQLLRDGKKQEAVDLELEADTARRRAVFANGDGLRSSSSSSTDMKEDETTTRHDWTSLFGSCAAGVGGAERHASVYRAANQHSADAKRSARDVSSAWELLHSNTYDPFTTLSVELAGQTLEHCLAKFFAVEQLVGRCYVTPREVAVHATKQFLIHVAPPVLIIHLKRFGATGQKIGKLIRYPLMLDVSAFTTSEACDEHGMYRQGGGSLLESALSGRPSHHSHHEDRSHQSSTDSNVKNKHRSPSWASSSTAGDHPDRHSSFRSAAEEDKGSRSSTRYRYELNSVCVHEGNSINHGHYYSVVRASNGLWYECNDAHVGAIGVERAMKQQAYMLFYSRVETNEQKSDPPAMRSTEHDANRSGATHMVDAAKRVTTWRAPAPGSPPHAASDEVGTELTMAEAQELLRARSQSRKQEKTKDTNNSNGRTDENDLGGSGWGAEDKTPMNKYDARRDGIGARRLHPHSSHTLPSDEDEQAEEECAVRDGDAGAPGLANMPGDIVRQLAHSVAGKTHRGTTLQSHTAGNASELHIARPQASSGDDNGNTATAPHTRSCHGFIKRIVHKAPGIHNNSSAHDEATRTSMAENGEADSHMPVMKRQRRDEVVNLVGWSATRELQRHQMEQLPETVRRPVHAPKFQQTIRDAMWEMEMDKGRLKKVKAKKPVREVDGGVNPFQEVASSRVDGPQTGRAAADVKQTHTTETVLHHGD